MVTRMVSVWGVGDGVGVGGGEVGDTCVGVWLDAHVGVGVWE